MPLPCRPLLALTLLCAATSPVHAGPAEDARDAARDSSAHLRQALGHVLHDDRVRTGFDLDRAAAAVERLRAVVEAEDAKQVFGRRARALRRQVSGLLGDLDRARTSLDDDAGTQRDLLAPFRKAIARSESAVRAAGRSAEDATRLADARRARSGVGRSGERLTLRVLPQPSKEDWASASVRLVAEPPFDADEIVDSVVLLSRGRVRVRLGDVVGAAAIEVTVAGESVELRVVNRGRKGDVPETPEWGGNGPPAPSGADVGPEVVRLRVAEASTAPAPTLEAGLPDRWTVSPALPPGLSVDPRTGRVIGTATATLLTSSFTLTAESDLGSVETSFDLQVAPPLEEGVEELEPGFVAERIADGVDIPVKLALAPDGRAFFTELQTGRVRILRADGSIAPTPFTTLSVLVGGERGLLGIALSPDFATDGHVFVLACVPASDGHPDRKQIVRYTEVDGVGTDPRVIVDDLPVGSLHNGGDLEFGPDGMLYVSLGDVTVESLAQTDGALAGRILRIAPDGTVPDGNPVPDDPEWARGLRNPFDLTFHPTLDVLMASENGPTANDELNYVQPGKNFEWGGFPPDEPLSIVGLRIIDWTPVIVPTGITFHDGTAFGSAYRDNLFVCGYDAADIRRLVLSGARLTDLDDELPFLRFDGESGIAHKPLDVKQQSDGSLLVSTFSELWRIAPFEPESDR